jgi:hypothetical protein
MRQRRRKLAGTLVLILIVIGWALLAMALVQGRIATLPTAVQVVAFIALGLVWVIPAGLLIRWMQRPDPE